MTFSMRHATWATALVAASVLLAAGLELVGVPAGLLLGPMVVAIGFAGIGRGLALPAPLAAAGQGLVGLLIATSLTRALARTIAAEPVVFAGVTAATFATGLATGLVLMRRQVLPGTAALWGSMPGAATAMTLLARAFDADERLVAVMAFSRVACVAVLASVIALVLGGGGGHRAAGLFEPVPPAGLALTALIVVGGIVAGRLLRLPAASLLGPMALGCALNLAGALHTALPPWLLAGAYAVVGWRIGFAFDAAILRRAWQAAPGVALSIGTLIATSALIGLALARVTGRDLLTCYLATSPGGADSVAIIASETQVDVPFVMAMQVLRFVVVLAFGPVAARHLARRLGVGDATGSAIGRAAEARPARKGEH